MRNIINEDYNLGLSSRNPRGLMSCWGERYLYAYATSRKVQKFVLNPFRALRACTANVLE